MFELLQNLNYKHTLLDIYARKYKLNVVTVYLTLPGKVSEEEPTLMAANLRKYNYEARTNTRPQTSSAKTPDKSGLTTPEPGVSTSMNAATIKADILSSLRKEISSVIREELKSALAKDFESLKKEMIDLKTEIANNTAAIRTEVEQAQANVKAVEDGLSAWSDEVVSVRTTVTDLKKQGED